MKWAQVTTGSDVPERLGCSEQELHSLIGSRSGYDRIIDTGCGEGWCAVGLAWRMSRAEVRGFDMSCEAHNACALSTAVNGVSIHIEARPDPQTMQRLVGPKTLFVVGAEIETRDLLPPGATEAMLRCFPDRAHTLIEQQAPNLAVFPSLDGLTVLDQQRALSEGRPRDQRCLWLPARAR